MVDPELDRVCVCGHRYGMHVIQEPSWCGADDCDCEAFADSAAFSLPSDEEE